MKYGDVVELGNHLLMCGDSTNPDDVKVLFENNKAKLCFTSPPYADIRNYNQDTDMSVNNMSRFIPTYAPYVDYFAVNLGIVRRDHEIQQYWNDYIDQAKNIGLKLLAWNVWDKMTVGSIGQQRAMFPIKHEFIFVFGKEYLELNKTVEKKKEYIGWSRKHSIRTNTKNDVSKERIATYSTDTHKKMESILSCMSEKGMSEEIDIRTLHPAVFPIKLPMEYISAMTQPTDIVCDPFGGSGSTMLACERLERRSLLMEISSAYCEVIIRRFKTVNRHSPSHQSKLI